MTEVNEQNVSRLYLITLVFKRPNANVKKVIAVDYGLSHIQKPEYLKYVKPYENESRKVAFKDLRSATIIEYPVPKADTPLLSYENGTLKYLSLYEIAIRNGYKGSQMDYLNSFRLYAPQD